MSDKIKKFFTVHSNEILPFMLSLTLCSALYSIYGIGLLSEWTLAFTFVSLLTFMLCRFINKHNFAGGVILIIIVMFAFSGFIRLIMGHDYGESFQRWFLTGAESFDTQIEFLLAFLISFVPFFSAVVYYFSVVLYRMSFLTLISLIPCAVSVKVLSDIDNVYISVIALLNVAVLMTNIRSENEKGRQVIGRRASVLSAAVFSFVLLIISAAIPKETEARYYYKFEELFMNSGNTNLSDSYSFLSEFSGGADSFRNYTNRRMYTIYGSNVPYFKRQTFDIYDYANDRWQGEQLYSAPVMTGETWAETAELQNLEKLRQAIIAADEYSEGFAEKYALTDVIDFDMLTDEMKYAHIQSEDFGAIYYLMPVRGINVNNTGQQIFVTNGGVFRNLAKPHDNYLNYEVEYYEEFKSRVQWLEIGGANFDDEKCSQMLSELTDILLMNNDELASVALAYYDVHEQAMRYKHMYSETSVEIPASIAALAREITDGMEYDWQKANALQNYFISSGFIYDLDYYPPDKGAEYFLFESKRGSCSDFATAYVLMARSLGLTARYAEGYSPDITGDEGVFIVRDSCSHAYPEVYIQNLGWIVFEPTVPSDYNNMVSDGNTINEVTIDYHLVTVLCIIAAIVLACIIAFVLLYPYISEKMFVSKVMKSSGSDMVVMIYKRIANVTVAAAIKNTRSMTPYELAERINELTGCDISELVYILEKAVYGNSSVIAEDEEKAMACYNNVCAAIEAFIKEKNNNERNKFKK